MTPYLAFERERRGHHVVDAAGPRRNTARSLQGAMSDRHCRAGLWRRVLRPTPIGTACSSCSCSLRCFFEVSSLKCIRVYEYMNILEDLYKVTRDVILYMRYSFDVEMFFFYALFLDMDRRAYDVDMT